MVRSDLPFLLKDCVYNIVSPMPDYAWSFGWRTFELTMQKRSSIMASMNKLDKASRAKIIHLLCEGMSIRAITRVTGVSKTTVSKWWSTLKGGCLVSRSRVS